MESPIYTSGILKGELIKVLGSEIGTCDRPSPLTPIPSIFVGAGAKAARGKIRVADANSANPVPALEVVINSRPNYESRGRNFGTRLVDQSWQIWLIFHDRRQLPDRAVNSILASFKTAGDFRYIPATELMPEQYTMSVARKTQLLMHS